jgi:hypothetical protein
MRLKYVAVTSWLAASGPVLAEVDFRRDPDAAHDLALISACIDAATSWESARSCANITYRPCISRIEGNLSHAAQAGCNSRERDLWLHLLSLEAMKIEAWTLLKDQQMRATGDNRVHAHDGFLRFQTAWTEYLQAQCRMEVAPIGTGNAKMTDEPVCQITVIAVGILKLRALQSEMSVRLSP